MNSSCLMPCGCSLGKSDGLITSYVRCLEHYVPEDDATIIEAARNLREVVARYRALQALTDFDQMREATDPKV